MTATATAVRLHPVSKHDPRPPKAQRRIHVARKLAASSAVRDGTCLGETREEERERLLLQHMPQVRLIAKSLREQLRFAMEFEDLVSYGVIGLLKAIERFDPERGVLLKTYAEHRIRGAILDGARAMDWLPRSVRQKERQYQKSLREAEAAQTDAAAGAAPSPNDPQPARRPVARVGVLYAGADLGVFEQISQQAGVRNLLGGVGGDPEAEFQRSEMRTMLAHAVSCLPDRHREVLRLYYKEDLSMKRIGAILRIHESRVSQLHAAAIERLRSVLAPGRKSPKIVRSFRPKHKAQPPAVPAVPAAKDSKYFVAAAQSSSVSTPMVSSAVSAT